MNNYKRIGDYIKSVKVFNSDLRAKELLGINIDKFFMPSVANVVGTDLSRYKIVEKNQFACNRMHVGRDYRIPVALSDRDEPFMVSPAYDVFEIKDTSILHPEYLMMWFSRAEFDRNAWFYTDADVRGGLAWKAFCEMQLPVPSIEKQREIVKEYNTIVNRIKLNEQLNQKLEETAQAIYKQWFVDNNVEQFNFLNDYIDFNPKHTIKKESVISYVEMSDVQENSMSIKNTIKREFTSGSKFKNKDVLLARITPCLENGKTAFVDCLEENEVAYGSTEFIVLRAKKDISPFWVYCLAKDEEFRSYAVSSMVGSSGRQRVHSDYLKEFKLKVIDKDTMCNFHTMVKPIFEQIKHRANEVKILFEMRDMLLSKMTKVETEKETV
ncbi:MAG: restriction endonuclease subunit S [Thiohalospira sp.]